MRSIEILPYNPAWAAEFITLAAALTPHLPPDFRLHHIGSTAVPGLPAKDIIDIQLTVDSTSTLISLTTLPGFELRPHILSDHCPPTLALTPEDLTKRFFHSTTRPANLHIRVRGRFNQRYALLCRDYLRAHPATAAAYCQIKQRLAARAAHDIDFYYDIKDPVFDIILDGAAHWAHITSWHEPAPDYPH